MKNRIDTHQYCELPDLGAEISFQFNGKNIQAYTTDTILQHLLPQDKRCFHGALSITGLGVLMTYTAKDMNHW